MRRTPISKATTLFILCRYPQSSHVVHAVAAFGLLAASFGHIFMGTVAMEGAFEAMKTGYCDESWAKEHHDLWYEEIKTGEN